MTAPERPAVLVTGATGFLGRYVVTAAVRAGLTVRAVVRPGTDQGRLPWGSHPRLQLARADLRRPADLRTALDGCDTVVHLAAVKGGDLATRFQGTVVATENLLAAMTDSMVERLVHCGTFSVYDYLDLPTGALLDEQTAVEDEPLQRDEYAQVKIAQERLVREWAASPGRELTVLRPGLIYGPGELWHALLGVELIPSLWLGAGARTTLPMAWVENVAEAFALAAQQRPLAPVTANLIDDRLPTVRQYVRAVRPHVEAPPRVVRLGYPGMRALVGLAAQVDRRLLGSRLKLPSGLAPASFEARFRPVRYSNEVARQALGWVPAHEFPETVTSRIAEAEEALRLDLVDAR